MPAPTARRTTLGGSSAMSTFQVHKLLLGTAHPTQQLLVSRCYPPVNARHRKQRGVVHNASRVQGIGVKIAVSPSAVVAAAHQSGVSRDDLIGICFEPPASSAGVKSCHRTGEPSQQRQVNIVAQVPGAVAVEASSSRAIRSTKGATDLPRCSPTVIGYMEIRVTRPVAGHLCPSISA